MQAVLNMFLLRMKKILGFTIASLLSIQSPAYSQLMQFDTHINTRIYPPELVQKKIDDKITYRYNLDFLGVMQMGHYPDVYVFGIDGKKRYFLKK